MTTSSSPNSGNGSRRRRARTLGILSGALGVLLSTASTSGQAAPGEAQPAAADSVRYDRESGKVKTKNTLETKFKAAAQEAEKDKKRKVQMLSADDFAKRKEAVAREVADDQIQLMKALLDEAGPNSPEYPDYLFRLADLFLDKKAYFDNQSGALYEKIYEAEDAKKTAEAKQLKQRQAKFDKQSKDASADAVKVYSALVNKPQFSKYKRMDEALYFYAFELGQLERESEMQEAYLRLIREYPQSKYIPNAYLSFADFYYNKSQIKEALQLYQKIVDGYRDSPVYAYALYKMGWCYLNPVGTAEPEYAKSLEKFTETVKATLEGRAGSEGNAKQLRRDARRDMVKAYVHAGKPSKAQEFFEKIGDGPKKDENMSRKQLELLAAAYFGEGMYVESTATYKGLQQKYNGDAMECTWQAAIVVNALASDDKVIQWKETEQLGNYWNEYKDSKFKKATKKKCRDEARDTMVQMATVWHDEAEKTRMPATYALSEDAYRAFLQVFPEDKDAYEMNYYYAEIIWAQATNLYNSKDRKTQEQGLAKFRLAHEEFVKVLERKPDGKYTQDSAYAQMLAMKNHLEYDETGGKGKSCQMQVDGTCVYREKTVKKKKVTKDTKTDTATEYPETPYTEEESSMLKAYDIYQKYVKKKDDAELPKIQYHRAKLMMEHNKFDEAKPVAINLIEKHDGTVYAAWAAAMLIDLLTIKWSDKDNTPEQTIKTSEELEKWAIAIQKKKLFTHKEAEAVAKQVPTLLAGIRWKKAEAYQEQGKQGDREGFVKCGEEYAAIYNDYETHDRADTLLFNAARCFEAAYLVGNAVKTRKALLDTFPESQHYQQTLREIGENYQAIAYYGDAAERFEQYAAKYTKDEFASDALRNAYLFRLGLGEEEKAQADLNKYEDLYKRKDPKTAAKIFWSKHALLDTDEKRLQHARAYIKTYGGKGGSDRQAVAEAAIGQILWRQSCEKELLYDSCLTVKRSKATAGEETRKKAEGLRKKGKKGKQKEEIPKYCGSATQGIITVHKRDSKLASEAQGHFAATLRLASKKADIPADDNERAESYKNAVGMAMVYKADQKYEEYLRINIPGELEFYVEEWKKGQGVPKWDREYKEQLAKKEDSEKRFKAFYDSKSKLGDELAKSYADVKTSGSPYWVLAAAARSAVLSQNFADQLYRAEVPGSIKTEDMYFAYCDALATFAEAAEKRAVDAFTYCLQKSTEFQFFNQFSRMCEEELQQREPNTYPATNEMFGESIYTDSRLDVVGVQTNLLGENKQVDSAKKKEGGEAKKDDEDGEGGGKSGL
jgi:TolA-binding protein